MIGKEKILLEKIFNSKYFRGDRKQLVGLVPINKAYGIEEGQQVIEEEDLRTPIKNQ